VPEEEEEEVEEEIRAGCPGFVLAAAALKPPPDIPPAIAAVKDCREARIMQAVVCRRVRTRIR